MPQKRRYRQPTEIRKEILEYFEKQTFPRTTGQVAKALNLNWFSTSHHLAMLKAEGKLFHEKVGRQNQWWPENIPRLTTKVRAQAKEIKELKEQIKELEREARRR